MKQKILIIIALTTIVIVSIALVLMSRNRGNSDDISKTESTPADSVMQKILAPGENLTLNMEGIGKFGQPGKAELSPLENGKTKILITLNEGTSSAQPVYLHNGNCTGIGEPLSPLVYAVNGRSETIVEDNVNSLLSQNLIIVVHKRIANFNNPSSYASCAAIK